MRVTVETVVPESDGAALLTLYRASVASLETVAAGVQAFDDDGFREQLRNRSILKLVGRDSDDHPEALCLVATDLADVPWVNPAFYANRFPDHYERGAILYVASVAVQPDSQGAGWAHALFQEVTRLVAERNGIAAFDCCRHNRELIPELAYLVSTRFAEIERHEIDTQHFYAYVTSHIRPEDFAAAGLPLRDLDLVALEAKEPKSAPPEKRRQPRSQPSGNAP